MVMFYIVENLLIYYPLSVDILLNPVYNLLIKRCKFTVYFQIFSDVA